jgi:hypothetical protein
MTATFDPAELKILRLLLERRFGARSPFSRRFAQLQCDNRRLTGTGYFLDLTAPEELKFDDIDEELSEAFSTSLPAPQDMVEFTLFIRGGRLAWLEGYTFGDAAWPDEPIGKWLKLPVPERAGSRLG